MALSKETVKYVADLSRIELSPQETEKLAKQLQAVLDFIDKLTGVDIKNINPTSHILSIGNVLREDRPLESLPIQKTLGNAPKPESNFFSVPKVIE